MQTIDDRARYVGLHLRQYRSLGGFSNKADRLGLKSLSLTKDKFGTCRLKMASASAEYEVLVRNGSALLGKIEPNDKRTLLAEASVNTELGWSQLFAALQREVKEGLVCGAS